MNTTALLRLVRIHSNDTISHPLVKQSTCSEGVWYPYSVNRNASAQPHCLLPTPHVVSSENHCVQQNSEWALQTRCTKAAHSQLLPPWPPSLPRQELGSENKASDQTQDPGWWPGGPKGLKSWDRAWVSARNVGFPSKEGLGKMYGARVRVQARYQAPLWMP